MNVFVPMTRVTDWALNRCSINFNIVVETEVCVKHCAGFFKCQFYLLFPSVSFSPFLYSFTLKKLKHRKESIQPNFIKINTDFKFLESLINMRAIQSIC